EQSGASLYETRCVRLLAYPASDYVAVIEDAAADLQACYDANKESITEPDQVAVQYLLLDEDVAMKSVGDIAEADLQAYYEQNKSRYVTAPRVDVSHVQISVEIGRASCRERV